MYATPEGVSAAEFSGLQPELARAHGVVRDKTRAGLDAEFACLNLPELMTTQLAGIEQGGNRDPPLPRRGRGRHRRFESGR